MIANNQETNYIQLFPKFKINFDKFMLEKKQQHPLKLNSAIVTWCVEFSMPEVRFEVFKIRLVDFLFMRKQSAVTEVNCIHF